MNYIPCLTGLRGLAILIVIFSHFHAVSGLPPVIYDIIHFSNFGSIGVRLFFSLSGFLITSILIKEYNKTRTINIKHFFIKRLFRIFPNFYFYLFVLFLLSLCGVIKVENDVLLTSLLYIQNINYPQNDRVIPYSWLVIHSWSLSVEEQFYLLYPFVFKILNVKMLKYKFLFPLAILLFSAFFRVFNYSYPTYSVKMFGFFFMHLDFLLIGGLLAFKLDEIKMFYLNYLSKYANVILLIMVTISIFASKMEYTNGIYMIFSGTLVLIAVIYVLLYLLLFPISYFGKFLETSIMKFLGLLSYSLYVWQQLFLSSTNEWLKYSFLTLFPYNLSMVFICALFSYYFIEKPFMRFRARFI